MNFETQSEIRCCLLPVERGETWYEKGFRQGYLAIARFQRNYKASVFKEEVRCHRCEVLGISKIAFADYFSHV